jgi:hypothetical protein
MALTPFVSPPKKAHNKRACPVRFFVPVVGWNTFVLKLDLLAYKVYLDRNYPEAFRVHDWLYSKNCPLSLTRDQADSIMYYAINAKGGSIDAKILYQAVRLGGASHWKKS